MDQKPTGSPPYPMASGPLAMMRPRHDYDHLSQERLPPLREAVPEIHRAGLVPDALSHVSRTFFDSPTGPLGRFPEANSLAPSPRITSRALPYTTQTLPPHSIPSPHVSTTDASPPSSESYERRESYPSSSGSVLATAPRGSPCLPPVQSLQPSSRGSSLERSSHKSYGLPPIYGRGATLPPQLPPYGSTSPYPPTARETSPSRSLPYSPYEHSSQSYVYPPSGYPDRPPFPAAASASHAYPLADGGSDYGDGKQKRRRGNLPKAVTDILRVWFHDHVQHPYPTEDEKQALMSQTGLTISQISNWFINARRRSLPQINKQAQTEAELRESQTSMPMVTSDELPARARS